MSSHREQVDRHKTITYQKISELEKSKSIIREIRKTTDDLSELTDRSIEKEQKKLELLDVFESADSSKFEIYEGDYEDLIVHDQAKLGIVTLFNHELGNLSVNSATAGASGDLIYLDSGSSYSGLVSLAGSILDGETKFEFEQLLNKDDFFDVADKLGRDLTLMDPSLSQQLNEIIRKYSAFEKKEENYSILLELRSLFFDNIFKQMCPEKNFCKAPWFKKGMKKHYCETRFFIQNNIPDNKIPGLLLQQVDNISSNLESNFHKLSDIGKEGNNAKDTDFVFKETIYSFAKAISLRNSLREMVKQGKLLI